MAETPMSLSELEEIVGLVVNDLVAKMVGEGDVSDEELPELVEMATNVTIFVIDKYMDHVNNLFNKKFLGQSLLP
jgi:hypothetical protein